MHSLTDTVAVVTGATRGAGVATRRLARQGARVYMTGRSAPDDGRIDEPITGIRCDHRRRRRGGRAFPRIASDANRSMILVNNAWGGYAEDRERRLTWPKPFWEQPLWRWDAMFGAGSARIYRGRLSLLRRP